MVREIRSKEMSPETFKAWESVLHAAADYVRELDGYEIGVLLDLLRGPNHVGVYGIFIAPAEAVHWLAARCPDGLTCVNALEGGDPLRVLMAKQPPPH